MKISNLLLGGALAITARAHDDPPRSDPPIAYFTSYKQPGCREVDQGAFITLTQTQDSICYVFDAPYPAIIQSAYVASIISGCVGESSTATSLYTLSRLPCADLTEQVYVYNDVNCTVNETTLDLGVDKCWDDTTGLNSFKAVCGRRYPTPRGSGSSSSILPTSAFLTRDE